MTPAQDIDARFEALKAFVLDLDNWSNIAIGKRLDEIYLVVQPVGSLKQRFHYAHAVIERSGSRKVITSRLEKLQAAVKEQTCLYSSP